MLTNQRKLQPEDIARIYRVPPWLVDPSIPLPARFSRERLKWWARAVLAEWRRGIRQFFPGAPLLGLCLLGMFVTLVMGVH